MKTSIAQVIDHLEKQIVKSIEPSARRTGDYRIGIRHSIEFCSAFIEIEKQQIMDAEEIGKKKLITTLALLVDKTKKEALEIATDKTHDEMMRLKYSCLNDDIDSAKFLLKNVFGIDIYIK